MIKLSTLKIKKNVLYPTNFLELAFLMSSFNKWKETWWYKELIIRIVINGIYKLCVIQLQFVILSNIYLMWPTKLTKLVFLWLQKTLLLWFEYCVIY